MRNLCLDCLRQLVVQRILPSVSLLSCVSSISDRLFRSLLQEGFAQPDQENGNGDLEDTNGHTVSSNGNGSALVAGEEDTY